MNGGGARVGVLHKLVFGAVRKFARRSDQRANVTPPLDSSLRVPAMLKSILITFWCSGRQPPVHPAPTVYHRWRLARLPAPCSCSAFLGPVHVQLHGVDSPISFAPRPPRRCRQWPVRLRGRGRARQ
jgi:hypothetical protein